MRRDGRRALVKRLDPDGSVRAQVKRLLAQYDRDRSGNDSGSRSTEKG